MKSHKKAQKGKEINTETQRTQRRTTQRMVSASQQVHARHADCVRQRQKEKRPPRTGSCLPFLFCLNTLRVLPALGTFRLRSFAGEGIAWSAKRVKPALSMPACRTDACVQGERQAWRWDREASRRTPGETLGLLSVFLCALCVSVINSSDWAAGFRLSKRRG